MKNRIIKYKDKKGNICEGIYDDEDWEYAWIFVLKGNKKGKKIRVPLKNIVEEA